MYRDFHFNNVLIYIYISIAIDDFMMQLHKNRQYKTNKLLTS